MGSGRRKKKLFTRGESCSMRVIMAFCQSMAVSIVLIALLTPRVAVAMVASQLPEAELVSFGELQRVHPFCRFPEIEMRHQQACGPAVFRRKGLAREFGG